MKLFFLIFFLTQFSKAEYRVFILKIENTQTQTAKTIKSTLDPEQYKSIYLLKPTETISYVDTWRCMGSTRDFMPLCNAPPKIEKPPQQNVQNKS